MKRPLAYTGGAFFLALLLANILGFKASVLLGLFFLVASAVIGIPYCFKGVRIWAIPCFSAFLACVIFCLGINIFVKPIDNELAGKTIKVSATVLDISQTENYSDYTVKSEIPFANGKTKKVKYIIYQNAPLNCDAYDILNFDAEFSKIEDDYTDSNYAKNIFINVRCVSEIEVVSTHNKPFLYYPQKCKEFLISVINEKFSKESGGLIIGIMTGEKGYMTSEVKENIRVSGLSHVTAVSGLHISILASFIVMVLSRFNISKGKSIILALVPLWFFVFVTGMPYSTIRSAFMFTMMAVGMGFFRRNDSISALFGSLMVCGLISPFSALDVGLLSSASATFGLLVLFSPTKNFLSSTLPLKIRDKKWCEQIVASFSATLAAIIGLLPCTILFYKTFSLVVLISNLLVLPLVTVLLTCSLFGGLLYYAGILSSPLLFVAGIASKITIFLCKIFSSIPFAEISVARSYITVTLCGILFMIGLAVILSAFGKNTKRMTALLVVMSILCLLFSVGSYGMLNRNKVEIYVVDRAQHTCTLVNYKGEIGLICNNPDYDTSKEITNLLRSLGKTNIDYMVIQENIKRVQLERITNKINVKECYVRASLEAEFPVVAVKKSKTTYVTDGITTPKGVTMKFHTERSEIFVKVGKFSTLILDRYLDFEEQNFNGADIVITSEASLEKVKNLNCSAVICYCKNENVEDTSRFFAENNVNGLYTGGYGTIRVSASQKGEYALSRIE